MSKRRHKKCANFLTTGCYNIVTSKKKTALCGECQRREEAERPETPEEETERIRLANEHAKAIGLNLGKG